MSTLIYVLYRYFCSDKIDEECHAHRPMARQHPFNDNMACGKSTCQLSWKKVAKSGYGCQTDEGDDTG